MEPVLKRFAAMKTAFVAPSFRPVHIMKKSLIGTAALLLASLVTAPVAQSQLFSTGLGNTQSPRNQNEGPSQRISVLNTTAIGSFGFWISTRSVPVDLKFMIWNEAQTVKLFEQTRTVNNASLLLTNTNAFDFTLQGGLTYNFAVVGLGTYDVSVFSGALPTTSQNGLTMVNPNRNFFGFANPTKGSDGNGAIALQIGPASVNTTVPEPSTYLLMATGLGAIAVCSRRRSRVT